MRAIHQQVLLLALGLLGGTMACAQELTPRAYWPAPEGTQAFVLGFAHTKGDTIPDPSLPVTGLDSNISTAYAAYLRTFDLAGRTANMVLEVPYSTGETRAINNLGLSLERDYQGAGDLSATLSVNLLGAPSMNKEEFGQLRRNPRPILGGSVKIVAPTGRYDDKRLINVSANRWAMKLELGYIQPLSPKWLAELEVGVWVFEDNDDFLGVTREQGSISSVEFHLVHRFNPGFWASLDLNGYRGGRSTVDGRRLDDLQRDAKYGATLVFPFAHKHALKLSYSAGSLNDSDENFDIYQLGYTRLF
jgi:Putative MetA-pathway of phenol degradation